MPETAKKHGVTTNTLCVWRRKFSSMTADDVKRLHVLEAENGKLKKLLVEKMLVNDVLREVNAKKMVSARAR